MKIGLISFSFGEPYRGMTQKMIKSIFNKFLGFDSVTIFVFSDISFEGAYCFHTPNPENATQIKMSKFKWIYERREVLKDFDLLYVIDADCIIVGDISQQDIIPENESSLSCVTHPWQCDWKNKWLLESNPDSEAYLDDIKTYVQSSFFGGYSKLVLEVCKELGSWAEKDQSKNIIPKWYDESYLNKYISKNTPRYLTDDYACISHKVHGLPDFIAYQDRPNKKTVKIIHFNSHQENQNEMIPIVFSFNKSYIPYAKVAINVMLKRCSSRVKLYCFGLELEENDFSYFRDLMDKFNGEFVGVNFNQEKLNDFREIGYLTKTTYLRLFIPEIVKEDKVIYCDCDTLFLSDITGLYNIPLNDNYIMGAEDWGSVRNQDFNKIVGKLNLTQTYINCGIIVLNNKALRSMDFARICNEVNKEYYYDIRYADQCIINKVLDGKKQIMPWSWNYQFMSGYESVSKLPSPNAIHFLEMVKMWMPTRATSENHEFWVREALSCGLEKEEIGIRD